MVIYKYKLKIEHVQTIKMPANARILSIQAQGNELWLWAEVFSANDLSERTFRIYGTGQAFVRGADVYLATVQVNSFVWHIYEESRV